MLDFYDVCIQENSHKVYKCKMIDGTEKLLQVYYDSETGDTSMFDFNNVYNNIEYGYSDVNTLDVKTFLNTVIFVVTDKYKDHHLVALTRID